MKVEWERAYLIGVHEIDNQHQELFARVNDLLWAMEHGRDTQELVCSLEFLKDYTKWHFAMEEDLQRRCEYPHYEMHAAEHRYFLRSLETLRERIEASEPTEQLARIVNTMLQNWLINHVCTIDRQLGDFISRDDNKKWEK